MWPAAAAREALPHHPTDHQEHTMTTTAVTANAASVAGLYEAFGRGDVPAILDRLADDVSWDAHWADHAAQRGAGASLLQPRRGVADVAGSSRRSPSAPRTTSRCWTSSARAARSWPSSVSTCRCPVAVARRRGAAPVDVRRHREILRFRHYVDTAKHLAAAAGTDTTVR
jgi:hypothetical protein